MTLGLDVPAVDTIPVLGIPVTYRCRDPVVIGAIDEAFGWWRSLTEYPELIEERGVTVSVVVTDGDEGGAQPIPFAHHLPDRHRFLTHTPGSAAFADLHRGDAVAYVTRSLLQATAQFRLGILESLTLLLAASRDRQPLHAALIRRGDVALLLAAPAGTGKSSVAYAAARAGWELLSDDATYVQLRSATRVWGRPGVAYLPEDTAHRFPNLRARRGEPLPNGKVKIPVTIGVPKRAPPIASRVGTCLLGRSPNGRVSWEPVDRDHVARFLRGGLGMQQDLYVDTVEPAARWVAARGGWRVGLSSDPREAVEVLDVLADHVAAQSV